MKKTIRKVLIIANSNFSLRDGKYWTFSRDMRFYEELERLGYTLSFVGTALPAEQELCTNIAGSAFDEHPGFKLYLFPSFRVMNPLRKLLAVLMTLPKLVTAIRRSDFVYLYMQHGKANVFTRICKLLHRPYGLYVRGYDPVLTPESRFHFTYKNASFSLCTGGELTRIARSFGVDADEVVPMTSAFDRDPGVVRENELSDRPNILFVGRAERPKGIYELIDGFCELRKTRPLRLTIIGALEKNVREYIDAAPCAADIATPGTLPFDELVEYYKSAAVFCLPSYFEGFPRVIYEALSFSLPIVTTFVGSIPCVMHDGENALRIEPRSSADIAEKIARLLDDDELRGRLTAASRQTYLELYAKFHGRSHAGQLREKLDNLE